MILYRPEAENAALQTAVPTSSAVLSKQPYNLFCKTIPNVLALYSYCFNTPDNFFLLNCNLF